MGEDTFIWAVEFSREEEVCSNWMEQKKERARNHKENIYKNYSADECNHWSEKFNKELGHQTW